MNRNASTIITIIVALILGIIALKVIGAVLSFVVKLVVLALFVGAAAIVFLAVQKRLGGPRA